MITADSKLRPGQPCFLSKHGWLFRHHVYVVQHVKEDFYWGLVVVHHDYHPGTTRIRTNYVYGWTGSIGRARVYTFAEAVDMEQMPHEDGRWYAIGQRIFLDQSL